MNKNAPSDLIKKLNQIGIALSSETNLRRLLGLIVKEVRGFTHADAGSLYIRDENELRFEVAQNDTIDNRLGVRKDHFRPFALHLTSESIAGHVAITGEILNIKDVYQLKGKEDFFHFKDFDLRNNYRTQSMLVVPMLDHRSDIIGVLQLINALDENNQVISFSGEVEDLVLSLSSQAAVAIRNTQLLDSIKNIFKALVQYSVTAIDARSPHTAGHSERVAALSLLLASAINRQTKGPFAQFSFAEEELEELSYAAWLHDIGKIGVPEHILDKSARLTDDQIELVKTRFDLARARILFNFQKRLLEERLSNDEKSAAEYARDKELTQLEEGLSLVLRINNADSISDECLNALRGIAEIEFLNFTGERQPLFTDFELKNLGVARGNLTEEEYKKIQSHVSYTLNILNRIPFTPELNRVPLFAAAHHEMLNGTGYPQGLKAKDIPLQARIMSTADVYDALVASDRPYKRALPVKEALDILLEEAQNERLDKDVVNLFIEEKVWDDDSLKEELDF
ncbi:MAG: GAF domain-containing protein [Deltaproteobacteria bacterium]|nr:GAF domain-containing protein [Deltaproteobacteria bacterium]MBW2323021.1 GAF domain-containing protein [Deltaproteobacteria bacterium]